MAAEPARSVHTTWLYTLGSIVFFVGFLDVVVVLTMVETYLDGGEPLIAVLIVLTLVASAAQLRYCWFLRAGRGGGLPRTVWTIALVAPAALVWVLGLIAPGNELAAAVPVWVAACLIACLLPTPRRRFVLFAGLAVTVAHAVLAATVLGESFAFVLGRSSSSWMIGIYAAMLPVMLLSSVWWWEVVVQLDRHRRTAAELAVTQERLRFASDLHDIQGHHLQVISLKSELAERLLEIDPAAAREHLHETRLIAKQALEETRSLVAGYRTVAFDDELENAREVLTASGAECALQIEALPADVSVQRALASVVREATTNILRHSEATRVRIELATSDAGSRLTIVNDGVADASAPSDPIAGVSARVGSERAIDSERAAGSGRSAGSGRAAVSESAVDSGRAAGSERAAGSGLAGLRERLAAVGGTLDASTDASGTRFELRASVPVAAQVLA